MTKKTRVVDLADRRTPDFIICGAPKCGTSSMHFILEQHPDISIPDPELLFFDADDPIVHPDFFFTSGKKLMWRDVRLSEENSWESYLDNFEKLPASKFTGEDSTSYIFSESAPFRIRTSLPHVRLIFMLRHPVDRAYSQFWHLVKTGRVTYTFEQAIFKHPSIILGSTYTPHIRRYMEEFGRDRVLVETLEHLKTHTQDSINRVTDFIGAAGMDTGEARTWFNKTSYPTTLSGQLALNHIGKHLVRLRYYNHIRMKRDISAKLAEKLHHHWFNRPNKIFMKRTTPLPMNEDTRAYLLQHLSARNKGLSELLGIDLPALWPGMEC